MIQKAKLGSREYEYFLSAAVMKKHGKVLIKLLQDREEGKEFDMEEMIDLYADFLYRGMCSARLSMPFYKRIFLNAFKPIPKTDKIMNLMDFQSLQSIIDGKEGDEGGKK
jgi:hypothetical protein